MGGALLPRPLHRVVCARPREVLHEAALKWGNPKETPPPIYNLPGSGRGVPEFVGRSIQRANTFFELPRRLRRPARTLLIDKPPLYIAVRRASRHFLVSAKTMTLLSYISVPRLDPWTGRVVQYDRYELSSAAFNRETPPVILAARTELAAGPDGAKQTVPPQPPPTTAAATPRGWLSFMFSNNNNNNKRPQPSIADLRI